MVFGHIEKLKRQYTDKFVVVDDNCPELRRFDGMTGTVRTVNMSGRALVEFDAYNNIGWYDIDIDFLKVVEAPLPKAADPAETKKTSPKPPAKSPKTPSRLEKARGKSPSDGNEKMSIAEKLAAARSQEGGSATAPSQQDPSKMSVADMLAAARAEKSGAPASATPAPTATPKPKPAATTTPTTTNKLDPSKMSVAEMLAAARAEKSGAPASATPAPTATPKPKPAATTTPTTTNKLDPSKMSVADMLAAARAEKSGGQQPTETANAEDEKKAAIAQQFAALRTSDETVPSTTTPKSAEKIDPTKMSVEDMLAHARGEKGGDGADVASTEATAEELPAGDSETESETLSESDVPASSDSGSKRDEITEVDAQVSYCRQVDGG